MKNKITIIALQVNNMAMYKKDIEDADKVRKIRMDTLPRLINGTVMIPARAVSEALNAKVDWNESTHTLDITMEYESIGDFYEDMAVVEKNGKYGAINKNRELVIPLEYEKLGSTFTGFTNGIINAVKDEKEGYNR